MMILLKFAGIEAIVVMGSVLIEKTVLGDQRIRGLVLSLCSVWKNDLNIIFMLLMRHRMV